MRRRQRQHDAFDRRRPAAQRPRAPGVAVGVAILMVVLAAVGARLRRMPSATALALRSLVVVRGAAPVRPPVALLYVDRACPHCRPAATRFDSLARTARVPAFIVSTDRLDSAAALAR